MVRVKRTLKPIKWNLTTILVEFCHLKCLWLCMRWRQFKVVFFPFSFLVILIHQDQQKWPHLINAQSGIHFSTSPRCPPPAGSDLRMRVSGRAGLSQGLPWRCGILGRLTKEDDRTVRLTWKVRHLTALCTMIPLWLPPDFILKRRWSC